jgi:hemerythrin-like domain-containing protein
VREIATGTPRAPIARMNAATLPELLAHDHARLERLFVELSNAVEGADQPTLAGVWTDFEHGLLTHLEAEERYLLPLVEPAHPEEAGTLRREHARIRALILDLGVRTDLHILRQEAAAELLDLLRRHAEWEDRTLYPWAEAIIDDASRRSLIELLRAPRRAA